MRISRVFIATLTLLAGLASAHAEPAKSGGVASWLPFLKNYENPTPHTVLPGTQQAAAPQATPAPAAAEPAKPKPKKKLAKKKKPKAKKLAKKRTKKPKTPKTPEPEDIGTVVPQEMAAAEQIEAGRAAVTAAPDLTYSEPPLTGTPLDALGLYKEAMASGDIYGGLALLRQAVHTKPNLAMTASLNELIGITLPPAQAGELVEIITAMPDQLARPAAAARIEDAHAMIAQAAAPSLVNALGDYKRAMLAGDRVAALQALTRVLGRPVDDEAARQADALLNIPQTEAGAPVAGASLTFSVR